MWVKDTIIFVPRDVHINTDTWGQLVSTTLNHKTCINTSRQVLEKTLFAINAIFTQDTNLSKPKGEGFPAESKRYMSKCNKPNTNLPQSIAKAFVFTITNT